MHQLRWFHLKRNIKNRVRKRHWEEILKELNEIINAEDSSEGEERLKGFIDKWARYTDL